MLSQNTTESFLDIQSIISDIYGKDLHKKRQLSLSYAAMGLLKKPSLFLHDMGLGMADSRGVNKKHATKQIDRLLSNQGLSVWELSKQWIPYTVASKKDLIVALDWTSFAGDEQHMLSLNVVTSKGCSTPLIWKTVAQQHLKHNRARYEDQMLSQLKESLPMGVEVTLLADRGFASRKFFEFLEDKLNFNYIIRIQRNTTITSESGEAKKAHEWLPANGKIKALKQGKITLEQKPIEHFVSVHDKGMKAPWFLVSNLKGKASRLLIKQYAKRWKIEPYFRDMKSGRYGYGLKETHIKSEERRDRLFLIIVLCYTLLIVLGEQGNCMKFKR